MARNCASFSIRRIMPATGAIDFSPLVLIIGLNILTIILRNVLL